MGRRDPYLIATELLLRRDYLRRRTRRNSVLPPGSTVETGAVVPQSGPRRAGRGRLYASWCCDASCLCRDRSPRVRKRSGIHHRSATIHGDAKCLSFDMHSFTWSLTGALESYVLSRALLFPFALTLRTFLRRPESLVVGHQIASLHTQGM